MDSIEFGRYLAQQRELRGMSRDEVARATRIPPSLLLALETGQSERMPGRVFVLNYIRAYAQVIGLSPEEAVLRFEEIDASAGTPADPAAGTGPAPARRRRRRAGAAVALLVVASAGAAALWYFGLGVH